ncbi:MAG TPA: DinB family protein [Chthonomonadaceae bacterium]|nr:DinB family protein [Chthonomonadaceae bacterium]
MNEDADDPRVETWLIHDRINRYLLDAIPDDAMAASLTARGRTVTDLFAHIHNVRLMWLKAAAPELLAGLDKLDPKAAAGRERISGSLAASGEAIAALLRQSLAAGRIKGFKPHPSAFLGYLISHESHHRGQIEYVLRLAGTPVPDSISYGLWEWGVR